MVPTACEWNQFVMRVLHGGKGPEWDQGAVPGMWGPGINTFPVGWVECWKQQEMAGKSFYFLKKRTILKPRLCHISGNVLFCTC